MKLSQATIATIWHFVRLAIFGGISAVLTYGIIPWLSTVLPALHFANAGVQAFVLLLIPVVLETIKRYSDTVNSILQQEENAQEVASLESQIKTLKTAQQNATPKA